MTFFNPLNAVCKIYSGAGQGSGALIRPNVVLTASHVVQLTDGGSNNGKSLSPFTVTFNNDPNNTQYVSNVARFNNIPDANDQESLGAATQDFALILLQQNVSGVGYFGYCPDWNGGSANFAGYPNGSWVNGAFGVGQDVGGGLWDCSIMQYPGISGGPIWRNDVAPAMLVGDYVCDNLSANQGFATRFTGQDVISIEYWLTLLTGYSPSVDRLYRGVLGRGPDTTGWAGWTAALWPDTIALFNSTGLPPSGADILKTNLAKNPGNSVVEGFINSYEFGAIFGTPDNTQFVTLLYNHILGRAPDDAGLAGWVNALVSGQATKAQVVIGFSESSEAIAILSAQAGQS